MASCLAKCGDIFRPVEIPITSSVVNCLCIWTIVASAIVVLGLLNMSMHNAIDPSFYGSTKFYIMVSLTGIAAVIATVLVKYYFDYRDLYKESLRNHDIRSVGTITN